MRLPLELSGRSKSSAAGRTGFTLIELLSPLIGDAMWTDAWPSPLDGMPPDREKGGGGGIGNFCINRHTKSIHLTFMDSSGRKALVDKLKTLYWSTHQNWPAS